MIDVIRNAHGERLDFAFHAGAPGAKELVVIGHGVTGHKDRPFLVALAEGLAHAGIPALRVSWSGNGTSEGRFADCTISKEVSDLGAVLDAVDGYAVTYAGHSMGGAVGVLRARADRRIGRLISLAGMVHVAAFAARHFGSLTPERALIWGKPGCVLSPAYMDDLRRIGSVVDRAEDIAVDEHERRRFADLDLGLLSVRSHEDGALGYPRTDQHRSQHEGHHGPYETHE